MTHNELREHIKEITDSLYQTGINDGKNDISYFPKPHESYYHVDRILSLIRKALPKKEEKLVQPKALRINGVDIDSYGYGYSEALSDITRLLEGD